MRVKRTQFDMSFLKDASDTSHTWRDEQNDGHLRAFGIHCEPGAAIAGEVKSGNTLFISASSATAWSCLQQWNAGLCWYLPQVRFFFRSILNASTGPVEVENYLILEFNQEKSCWKTRPGHLDGSPLAERSGTGYSFLSHGFMCQHKVLFQDTTDVARWVQEVIRLRHPV